MIVSLWSMANLLAAETSPYLRQHRENPVHWRPWGEEALAEARAADKPILVSVGYSSCHWCHVMERESFEDPEVARYMNEHFVNVKVDREERPDVDALYMEALQGMTGQGGWPMTVFCDPDGVPFHAGTYFPPEPTGGMPSFQMVLEAVIGTFRERRDEIRERAPKVTEQLGMLGRLAAGERAFDEGMLDEAVEGMMRRADQQNGGFGGAPKFPPASALEFLIDRGREQFVELSLDRMMAGGMYDQIGGGFARYSVDAVWMVPHFEKMLYDNALLARLYLHGWQRLGRERYRRVCKETLNWALREMLDQTDGFHSALDADSEGVEGRFYVWTDEQLRTTLGEAGFAGSEIDRVASYFGVTESGNFEGANVLHLATGPQDEVPDAVERARTALFEARGRRVWPGLDDKVLTSWNGLMITALAEAGAVLGEYRYVAAAARCAEAVLERMRDDEGHLLRTMTGGEARINAFLEDYAYMVEALLVLYEASFERRWYESAEEIADRMIERFHDGEHGGFFTTPPQQRDLITRRKDLGDHPIPSGNSAAALGLRRLAALSGDREKQAIADGTLRVYADVAVRNPEAFGHMLQAGALSVDGPRELALIAPAGGAPLPEPSTTGAGASGVGLGEARVVRDALKELLHPVWEAHRPGLVRAGGFEGAESPPLLAERMARDGRPTAYLCREFACREPVSDAEALRAQLSAG